jgi:HTH-type transcriptional regulator/antitoxin MqsA
MMFRCHVCGFEEAREEKVSEVFMIGGKPVLVEQIPAFVCARCREAIFSRETTENIRRMVNGNARPNKSVRMDVFAYTPVV